MPRSEVSNDEEEIQASLENIRITRATARRLGSVEKDAPGTPKRSNSVLSLETIAEDTSPANLRSMKSTLKGSSLSPVAEKGKADTAIGTPVRKTKRQSMVTESPARSTRSQRQNRDDSEDEASTSTSSSTTRQLRMRRQSSGSNLTQKNVETHNGRRVTFNESPEQNRDYTQFPKTPKAIKGKASADDSLKNELQDKQVSEAQSAQDSEKKDSVESDNVVGGGESGADGEKKSEDEVEKDAETAEEEVKNDAERPEEDQVAQEETAGEKEADKVVPEFSSNWTQSVSGQVTDDGAMPIDAFGTKERKEQEEKLAEHKAKVDEKAIEYKLVKIFSEEEEENEDEDEEEEKKKKSEFIDDEASEGEEDSMDEEEREYLRQQEIPEQGIEIGSEDTDEEDEEEDDGDDEEDDGDDEEDDGDDEEAEDTNFIAFSDEEEEENDPALNEDSLDLLEDNAEKMAKKRKRIIEVEESSSSDEEEEIETYKNTSLTKFSGTVLSNIDDKEEEGKAEEVEYDRDVTMVSLPSPSKKTPESSQKVQKSAQKTPKSTEGKSQKLAQENLKKSAQKTPQLKPVSRNLQSELEDLAGDEPQEDPAEQVENVEMANLPEEIKNVDEKDSESEDDDESVQDESDGDKDSEDEQWEDMAEEEEKDEKKLDKTESGSMSAILARCNEFLKVKRDDQVAQKKINAEKRAKRRAAKEKKMRLKKELEEKKAELERLKEELKEKKKHEKLIVKEEEQQLMKKVPEQEDKPHKKKKKKQRILDEEEEVAPRAVEPTKRKRQEETSTELPTGKSKEKKEKKVRQEVKHEETQKKKKKKRLLEENSPDNSGDSKRLPLTLLNQLSDNRGDKLPRKKRRAEEDPESVKPQKKKKSIPEILPKQVETPVGMFNVCDVDPIVNPFSIRDTKLLRKAEVTKQFKREKKLKQKKVIEEASCVFPRPTTSWTPSGIFKITDFQPQKKIVNSAGHSGSMEFVVTTLEPKKKMSKKSQVTSVFSTETEKPAKSFKDQKLYGNGVVRETSRDLMHRNIKKKFNKM